MVRLYWDDLEGELTYSPDELRLERTRTRRGRSSADLELALDLDNWGFNPESAWTFDLNLVGRRYGRCAKDAGDILRGARDVDRGISLKRDARGTGILGTVRFVGCNCGDMAIRKRARAIVHAHRRSANCQRRIRLAARAPGAPTGLVTGNLDLPYGYGPVSFDFTGAAIPLESIEKIQMARLPVGGRLNLQAHGRGTAALTWNCTPR